MAASILALNSGSSTVKYAVYDAAAPSQPSVQATLERDRGRDGSGDRTAAGSVIDALEAQADVGAVIGVGHRVVHGMTRTEPALVTPDLLDELRRATPFAPEHMPHAIELIEAFLERHPRLPQVVCFDTAFHAGMPPVAARLAIPRRYQAKGVRRYGFHGLSYEYLVEELSRVAGAEAASGRVILAHLGNGASLAAVHRGRSIDTSMGFTPAAGLVMSTRTGDLDPGLMSFLMRSEGMTEARFHRMINHESGLLGVSEISSDMRDLLAREDADARAAEAVGLFCYQARKWVGAFAAALGGLDTLVFSAGIGAGSSVIRARICDGLGFLGIELDRQRNDDHAPVISAGSSRVTVRVIPTNEELMIARAASRALGRGHPALERDT